ncbi:hypothetical protein HPB52_004926 [Rhipicephalus sanguineus]|uniref:Uncharacterized protein n=1 Tax=Rhipicephalus sanguineus TaxID=34632 RepID=A0A9D4QC90_RHISA|nr:hypothetical protein HPB52_004926 [Rhipicephalus sanguineus]
MLVFAGELKRLARKLHAVQQCSCDLTFHCLPSHVEIPGNEAYDRASKEAHDPSTAVTDFVSNADVGRLVARYVCERHPDPHVAAGKPPRRLPLRGLSRTDWRLLLRLRIRCQYAAEGIHRLAAAPTASTAVTRRRWSTFSSYAPPSTRAGLPCSTSTAGSAYHGPPPWSSSSPSAAASALNVLSPRYSSSSPAPHCMSVCCALKFASADSPAPALASDRCPCAGRAGHA